MPTGKLPLRMRFSKTPFFVIIIWCYNCAVVFSELLLLKIGYLRTNGVQDSFSLITAAFPYATLSITRR